MIAARLLGSGGGGAGAMLVEPDSRCTRTRGDSAHAEQLQHGFAACERRGCGERLIAFPCIVAPKSDFNKVDVVGIVEAQLMRRVGGGGDVARRTTRSFERGNADFGALAFDHLPGGGIERDAIFTDDERVGLPEAFGPEAGPPS